ncbi:MAG: DUF4974 domain-containing protein [Bacteroidales bacterium]
MGSESDSEIKYSIIKKYFEGHVSEEEKELARGWLNTPENSIKLEGCLRLLWKEMDPDAREPEIDMDHALDMIHHSINLKTRKERKGSVTRKSLPHVSFTHALKNIARIAAVLLLPIMGYLTWEVYSQKMWIEDQTEEVYNEIICPLGARSQFQLPDGTTGSLNNGSRLRYPVRFSGNTREVELVGEAYFDVSRDRKHPFIINTVGLDVKVTGTRLNVYSYPEESYQEFTLESGTIELIKRARNQEITIARMKPGQHLVYSYEEDETGGVMTHKDKQPEIIHDQTELKEFLKRTNPGQHAKYRMKEGDLDIIIDETEHYTAWKDSKLVLRNDPMPRLLKRIERWYNVKFNILDESIREYTFWATFEEENLEQVLRLLALTGPIEFVKRPREKMADGTYKIQEIDVLLKK